MLLLCSPRGSPICHTRTQSLSVSSLPHKLPRFGVLPPCCVFSEINLFSPLGHSCRPLYLLPRVLRSVGVLSSFDGRQEHQGVVSTKSGGGGCQGGNAHRPVPGVLGGWTGLPEEESRKRSFLARAVIVDELGWPLPWKTRGEDVKSGFQRCRWSGGETHHT